MGIEHAGDYMENRRPLRDREGQAGGDHVRMHKKRKDQETLKITPEIIGLVADCLGNRWAEWRIREFIHKLAGYRVLSQTVQKIISKAKELNRERYGVPTLTHKTNAVAFYEAVIANEAFPLKERIRAQERLDQLLGLEARYANNADPQEVAAKARELLAAIEATVTG